MIPSFPKFKKIEPSDIEDVKDITNKYPLYSDFSFSNIWSWDFREEMEISILNNNLVVRFTDYVNGEPFLSFIGENMITETTRELILFSKAFFNVESLKLVPEIIVSKLDNNEFDITSDRDSDDYVYSVDDFATMESWSGNSLSKGIRKFLRKYPDYLIKTNAINEISTNEYLEIFRRWSYNKKIVNHFELNEYRAFERMLKLKNDNLKMISLYLDNNLVAFSFFEIMQDGHALSHFAKADTTYCSSIYSLLNWEEAKIFKKIGIRYYNWQQDLGIHGLRSSKMKYKPVSFMKKFSVKKKI